MTSLDDATTWRDALLRGERTVREALDATLARIAERDPRVCALADVDADGARAHADRLDAARASAPEPTSAHLGALFGIPLVVKANMCVRERETNCGSRALAGWRPTYTATFVQRALDAGAIPIASAHMDEFAMGSSGENSAFGVARNPWDLERAPGGSSSGSAAAVAAGLAPLALGSDTGGSVRQPAAFTGVSGFKPTYGRVSRYGLVAFGSSLDQVAPLARSVRDLELVFGALAARDERDATSHDAARTTSPDAERRGLAGVRVALAPECFPSALDADVEAVVRAAIDELVARGAARVDAALPHLPHALPAYYVVAAAEASSNLARYDGVRFGPRFGDDGSLAEMMTATRTHGFGSEVKRRILLGTYVLQKGYQDAWYRKAQAVRVALRAELEACLANADVLALPTSPTPAFRLGERTGDPVAMYASDVLTVPASLAGLPAVSVPCGFVERDGKRLPVGLQLVGRRDDDERVLAIARAYQEATTHHVQRPEGFA